MYEGHINKGRRACAPTTTYWYQSSSTDTSSNHHLPSYNPLSSLLSSVLSLASSSPMQHLQNLNTSFPVQSWNEFMELSRFGKPDFTNLEHLSSRLLANLEYYSGNYLWIIGFLSVLAWYLPSLSSSSSILSSVFFYFYSLHHNNKKQYSNNITTIQQQYS